MYSIAGRIGRRRAILSCQCEAERVCNKIHIIQCLKRAKMYGCRKGRIADKLRITPYVDRYRTTIIRNLVINNVVFPAQNGYFPIRRNFRSNNKVEFCSFSCWLNITRYSSCFFNIVRIILCDGVMLICFIYIDASAII